jgi:hypothetical protein
MHKPDDPTFPTDERAVETAVKRLQRRRGRLAVAALSTAVLLLVAAMIAACATSPEAVAVRRDSQDDAACRSQGLERGTPAYGQCRLQMNQQHTADDEQPAAVAAPGAAGIQSGGPQH